MELWQLDVTGSVFLADGTECKLISGIDDHSRFCVIAVVVRRATGRAVCRAFIAAMRTYGIPDEVLSDNGKQFTGRFGKPRPAEVLFERICHRNGIVQRLTKPYSPTTTGKVERWHQTLQLELLNDAGPFASIEDAQAVVDSWRQEYNHRRPHQSLDMACPADRFRSKPVDDGLELWAPADLEPVSAPADSTPDRPVMAEPVQWPDAIEIDRVVPASGNMAIGPQPIQGLRHQALPLTVSGINARLHGGHQPQKEAASPPSQARRADYRDGAERSSGDLTGARGFRAPRGSCRSTGPGGQGGGDE